VVTQLSAGGLVRASMEYVLGTLGGAVYAGVTGFLIPHTTLPAQVGILAITIAPLAFAAAMHPNFRVAPFSAVLVLLIAGQTGEDPIGSAPTRLLEVALGGAIAVTVSLLVIPVRADRLAREAASRVLDEMAKVLPEILANFFRNADTTVLQDRIGGSIATLQEVTEEIKGERPVTFTSAPEPGPLSRTLLRLRHDLVILGRASAEPLPVDLTEDLKPSLDRAGLAVSEYFSACALALTSGLAPPPIDPLQAQLNASISQLAALRQRVPAHLSVRQLEHLFALCFALEQLGQNIVDLQRCVREWAISRRPQRSSSREQGYAT